MQKNIGNKCLIFCIMGAFALSFAWPYMNETEIFWNVQTAVILVPFAILGQVSRLWLTECNVSSKNIGLAMFLLGVGAEPI